MSRVSSKKTDCSIIALDKFIQATRDSGYKGTASAISELVDNSIQAGASHISILIAPTKNEEKEVTVSVVDDGCGMNPFTLRQALRFGGSTRFGDRGGLGRYGMGLPNASLSQARRVTVYSWQRPVGRNRPARARGKYIQPNAVYFSFLDIDEIVRGNMTEVPPPRIANPPPLCSSPSGTIVLWTECDRLEYRRISTIASKLAPELGRRFRHYLWKGLRITINGEAVTPIDPLYLSPKSKVSGARVFGSQLEYEIRADPTDPERVGVVRVRFSELPVHEWHKLSNDQKRRIGIANGAGVSVVRAGREVDFGWFFMGSKRRENYDDWWRCEIQFDPILDEAFGITHTKQQIRPQPHLIEVLTPDIEATARALNSRVRNAHLAIKAGERFSEAERVAEDCDSLLRPLPRRADGQDVSLMKELERMYGMLHLRAQGNGEHSKYRIIEGALKSTSFFEYAFDGKHLVLVLNSEHPFYREIYKPLSSGDSPRDQKLRSNIELLLLAFARSQLVDRSRSVRDASRKHRKEWSDTLSTFLNG